MKKVIRIGTRGSRLALAQAKEVKRLLQKKNPGLSFRLIVIKTTGDVIQSVSLFKADNIGVFTKELERKLLQNQIDIAVHSLKDLPTELPRGLTLAAFPRRRNTQDVILSAGKYTIHTLPHKALVGTASPRRKRQLSRLRPDLKIVDIRGNIDTRAFKVLKEKKYDAMIVARAGLERLGKYLGFIRPIPWDLMLPAVGQAALGLEVRADDAISFTAARRLNHKKTEIQVSAERLFLKILQGGCRVPVGIHSKIIGKRLHLKAAVFSVRSSRSLHADASGDAQKHLSVATALARKLIRKGAGIFLKEARSSKL